MVFRRSLIPLLTAVLVIQSLVAVVPHTHGFETASMDRELGCAGSLASKSALDGSHNCLACSVHSPVVEQAAKFGIAAGLAAAIFVATDAGSSVTLPVLTSGSPRGPPRAV